MLNSFLTNCLTIRRYERDHVIPGEPYAGFDRHNGEIAGFHLDGSVNGLVRVNVL